MYTPPNIASVIAKYTTVDEFINLVAKTPDFDIEIDINKQFGVEYYLGTFLNIGAGCGNIELIKFLLSKGADIEKGSKYCSPLMTACIMNQGEVIKLLIDFGADIFTTVEEAIYDLESVFHCYKKGTTLLDVAAANDNKALVRYLVSMEVKLTKKTTSLYLEELKKIKKETLDTLYHQMTWFKKALSEKEPESTLFLYRNLIPQHIVKTINEYLVGQTFYERFTNEKYPTEIRLLEKAIKNWEKDEKTRLIVIQILTLLTNIQYDWSLDTRNICQIVTLIHSFLLRPTLPRQMQLEQSKERLFADDVKDWGEKLYDLIRQLTTTQLNHNRAFFNARIENALGPAPKI